jgi:tripartite-type tricarboxylate transporter receptor subunit TctC
VVDAYYAGLVKVMADPDLIERFAGLGVVAQASTQVEFKAFLAAEHAKYSKLVADNNIKGE